MALLGTGRIVAWWRRNRPLEKAYDLLLAKGQAPTQENPNGQRKGFLRSRTVISAIIGFSAWGVLLTGWADEGTISHILTGLEAAGFGGAAVFRVLARVPMRRTT